MYYLYVGSTHAVKKKPKCSGPVGKQNLPFLTRHPLFLFSWTIERHVPFERGRTDLFKSALLFLNDNFSIFSCTSEKYYLIYILYILLILSIITYTITHLLHSSLIIICCLHIPIINYA